MITTEGSIYIKRYLAGFVPSIAESVAFGLGGVAESAGQTKLQFEVGRSDVLLTSYDFANNKLIFKAIVPEDFGGIVNEVALFSAAANAAAGEFGSKIITTFDSATEQWVDASTSADATFVATDVRIGADALRQAPAASGTKTDKLTDISMDLSGYSAADKFVLAFYAGNTNASSVRVRFLTDVNNYYEVNFGTPANGYNIVEIAKSAAVATGTPDWSSITEMRVTTNSSATGASQINFDGLRIEDADTINSDYVMVARELLPSSFTKQEGMSQEIEFALDVSV